MAKKKGPEKLELSDAMHDLIIQMGFRPVGGNCWVNPGRDHLYDNREVLDVDVTRARHQLPLIDHRYRCLVIHIERRGTRLRETEFREDRAKVLGGLGGLNGGNELCFSQAGSNSR